MSCEQLQASIKELKQTLNPQSDDWSIANQIDFYLPKECASSPTSHAARLSQQYALSVLERFRSEARKLIEKHNQ